MSLVPIRMKNKMLTKIHLDTSGQLALTPVKAASDLASKGISAQPASLLTEMENAGNPNPPPSTLSSTAPDQSTGAPTERVAPDTLLEVDRQPPMKQLEEAPSQKKLTKEDEALLATQLEVQPAEAPAPAPNEKISATPVLAPNTGPGTVVGKTETR